MKFATFHEWKAAHPEIVAEIKEKFEKGEIERFTCTKCEGNGYCECINCSDVHDCRECDGTGTRSAVLQIDDELGKLYNEQKVKDEALLKKFTPKDAPNG